jgi:hypothetical protein
MEGWRASAAFANHRAMPPMVITPRKRKLEQPPGAVAALVIAEWLVVLGLRFYGPRVFLRQRPPTEAAYFIFLNLYLPC